MGLFEFELLDTFIGIIISAFVGGLLVFVKTRMSKYDKESHAVKDGIRAMLRDNLIKTYGKCGEDDGYCPYYIKESVTDIFHQYELLGGNGAAKDLYEKIMDLPTVKPVEK